MGTKIDLLGRRFGRLTVIGGVPSRRVGKSKQSKTFWRCQCDCGGSAIVVADNLRSGNTESCGCFQTERQRIAPLVHGDARSKTTGIASEFSAWQNMIKRCENPNATPYKHYGGRGIKVCAQWRASYQAFLADVGRRPSPQHSLDRIDNNGDYAPGNVRWATAKQQANNRREPRHAAEERQIA